MSLTAERPFLAPALQRFRRSHEFWLLAVVVALSAILSLATDSFLTLQHLFDLVDVECLRRHSRRGPAGRAGGRRDRHSFTATACLRRAVRRADAGHEPRARLARHLRNVAGAVGIACGLINAAVFITVLKLRISSIIVSIATLNIFYGLLIFATGGKYITSLPKFFRDGIWWFAYEDASGVPYALNLQTWCWR